MKRVFVDTNVFLRFLTQDDQGQSEQAERLFRAAAAGEVRLVTGPPVLFELAWTLRRAYRVSREGCLDVLASVLALDGLELLDQETACAAVELARDNGQEFADAYIAASARGMDGIATFNEGDFRRLGATLYEWPGSV